jgi:glyoxylase-like metal-dependent hydrolase (beta-lactamase superfamily II)
LDVPLLGFRDFITPWLISERGGRSILVDPGPTCSVAPLTEALHAGGVSRLDLVLLTHIHIDHAGGTGLLLKSFPEAQVVAHPRGIPHLKDPTRLWASTLLALGESVARAYGEIVPVHESRFVSGGTTLDGLEVVETPGHSQHHQSYVYTAPCADLAFAGEAAGIYLGGKYIRPATPHRFFYETTTQSIETLKGRLNDARLILYGHYGYSDAPSKMLGASLDQLRLWRDVCQDILGENPSLETEDLVRHAVGRLRETDPGLAGLGDLPSDIVQRELYFLLNSARGFILAGQASGLGRN